MSAPSEESDCKRLARAQPAAGAAPLERAPRVAAYGPGHRFYDPYNSFLFARSPHPGKNVRDWLCEAVCPADGTEWAPWVRVPTEVTAVVFREAELCLTLCGEVVRMRLECREGMTNKDFSHFRTKHALLYPGEEASQAMHPETIHRLKVALYEVNLSDRFVAAIACARGCVVGRPRHRGACASSTVPPLLAPIREGLRPYAHAIQIQTPFTHNRPTSLSLYARRSCLQVNPFGGAASARIAGSRGWGSFLLLGLAGKKTKKTSGGEQRMVWRATSEPRNG
jgi:hypothetical protein